ncbi:hypothetical protein GTY20_30120 [Streptomyces sp. SID4946]|nr:hypothetical protein [Streptomyces sp. SID4946]MYR88071.1 hypothetical protein [Streptomyces sp. SID685]UWW90870.1 hypothetical protein GO605_08345 [Streptomyces murinus]
MPPRQFGRCLDKDLIRGHFGRKRSGWALDDNLAHCSPIPLPDPGVPPTAPCPASAGRRAILLSSREVGER